MCHRPNPFQSLVFAKVLVICAVLFHCGLAKAGDDHEHEVPGGGNTSNLIPEGKGLPPLGPPPGPLPPRERAAGSPRPAAGAQEGGCTVSPQRLADFANGEAYDFGNMVTFLSSPACGASSRQISLAAIASGVTFNDKPPFRLDNFAKALPKNDLESGRRIASSLDSTVPALLRQNPLGSNEMLPLVGQLSLLSPSAARGALAVVIQQEIYAGDARMQSAGKKGKDAAAADLARTLARLGASESAIASELAESVEDLALLAQADSLVKLFRGLSAAANVDAALVPTFNLSAGAFNRGIQRGKEFYLQADKAALQAAAFSAVRASLTSSGPLEPGAAELNEALAALMGNQALTSTSLKKFWKDAVRVLAVSPTQTALADAVALSLTPQVIFLMPDDMEQVLLASRQYPQVAGAVQSNFLLAWRRVWGDLHDGKISTKAFNRMKRRYFEPMVGEILDLDPYLIDAFWLKEVIRRGLVQDDDVEKRFPRFVLAFIERRDRASRTLAATGSPEVTLSAMAEGFAVNWTLSQVHVPALMEWVKKYEE